jgi:hypothetical protein
LVSFPTDNKGYILDLVLANNPERVLDILDVRRLGKSDHSILEMVVEGDTAPQPEQEETYDWNRADMKRMRG